MSQISAAAVAPASQTVEGKVELATQAEMETGTDTGRVAAVAVLKHLRLMAKLWVNFSPSGTIHADEGVDTVTDNGVGNWTVNFTTSFSSIQYVGLAMGLSNAVLKRTFLTPVKAVGSMQLYCISDAEALIDSTAIMLLALGDQ